MWSTILIGSVSMIDQKTDPRRRFGRWPSQKSRTWGLAKMQSPVVKRCLSSVCALSRLRDRATGTFGEPRSAMLRSPWARATSSSRTRWRRRPWSPTSRTAGALSDGWRKGSSKVILWRARSNHKKHFASLFSVVLIKIPNVFNRAILHETKTFV